MVKVFVFPTNYEIERLLARVASGMSTERDAEILRQMLAHYRPDGGSHARSGSL
jgi:hypothetical protein